VGGPRRCSKWITGNPLAGTVTGGDTNQQKLSFDATSLDEGNYTAEVQFTTNDPKNPYQAVKVKLIVRENQAPIANSQTITLNEDSRVAFEIKAKDEDGDKLSYSIVGQPQNGTLAGKAPNLTYTPKPNFNGTDTLSFKAFDGRKYSNIAKVTFQIKAVNDAPWAQSSEVNASEDEFFLRSTSNMEIQTGISFNLLLRNLHNMVLFGMNLVSGTTSLTITTMVKIP